MSDHRPRNPPRKVWTAERCYIAELLNAATYPEVSVARTWVEPGVTTQLHSLSVYEWYIIESGHGTITVGDAPPFEVGPGDTVTIPKQKSQKIRNSGNSDLVFLCVCAPRFTPDCYTYLE